MHNCIDETLDKLAISVNLTFISKAVLITLDVWLCKRRWIKRKKLTSLACHQILALVNCKVNKTYCVCQKQCRWIWPAKNGSLTRFRDLHEQKLFCTSKIGAKNNYLIILDPCVGDVNHSDVNSCSIDTSFSVHDNRK